MLAERQPKSLPGYRAKPERPVSVTERGNGVVEFILLLPVAIFLFLLTAEVVLYVISVLLTQNVAASAGRAMSLFDSPRVIAESFFRQNEDLETGVDPSGLELILRRTVRPFFGISIPGRLLEQQTLVPLVMRPCAVNDFEDNFLIQGELCV